MSIDETNLKIQHTLRKLQKLFVPEARLTFFMRVPGNDECSIVVTSDDLSKVSEVILKLSRRELIMKNATPSRLKQ